MKRKGILSGILTICLMLSSISIPVFGAEEDSKGLEQAIITAKNIITVPDDYSEFTHNLSEQDTVNGKVRVWMLNWSEKEGKNGYISASVGEDGFLYNYNKSVSDENSNGLAKVTKDEAKIEAEKFLDKVITSSSEQMKAINNNNTDYSGDEYNFSYQEFVNEVPVNFVTVNVGVNKYSGEVTSFSGENPEIKGMEYPSLDGALSQDEAEKAYMDKLGVSLKYYSYYDDKQKKMNIFAGYSIDSNENKAIDAKTGQVIVPFKDSPIYVDKADGVAADASQNSLFKGEQALTQEEIDAINNVSNLITKEKAESILREASDMITADMKVTDSSLNKNYINDGYTWRISFDKAYGEVDAKSGEVISLHLYNNNNTANQSISETYGKNIAENFLQKITPDKYAQTKYEDSKDPIILKIGTIQPEGDIFSFKYVRQVNGIEFQDNSLRVDVNKTNGKVVGYDNNWDDNLSFPDVSQAISKEAAFNKMKDLAGFGLEYTKVDKDKIGLVYNFNNNDNYIVDPISGIRLDFTGQAYKENKLPEYTDIKGQWCEKAVEALLDNGYYIDGDKFNANMGITQINFFKYMYSPVKDNYNSDDEFYDMLIKNGVIKKEEKAPNSLVSNQEAAKFVIRYLGYDNVAVHPEIFNNPFKDNIDEKYKGYAAMSYALNIIKGTNGNFNGTHDINNGEAAVIVYNLINVGKK